MCVCTLEDAPTVRMLGIIVCVSACIFAIIIYTIGSLNLIVF